MLIKLNTVVSNRGPKNGKVSLETLHKRFKDFLFFCGWKEYDGEIDSFTTTIDFLGNQLSDAWSIFYNELYPNFFIEISAFSPFNDLYIVFHKSEGSRVTGTAINLSKDFDKIELDDTKGTLLLKEPEVSIEVKIK